MIEDKYEKELNSEIRELSIAIALLRSANERIENGTLSGEDLKAELIRIMKISGPYISIEKIEKIFSA